MTRPWLADMEITERLGQDVIEAQFPELAPARVILMGVGWDNTAFLVNETFVFRFPRRAVAVPLMQNECRMLPFLAPRLPLPVPVPVFVGEANDLYPWPFAGYRRLEGRTACALDLADSRRVDLAEPLARFLAALHGIPTEEAIRAGAGADAFDRLSFAPKIPGVRRHLQEIADKRLGADIPRLLRVADSVQDVPAVEPCALAHGDLYARHLLVDAAGKLSGIIDWGDVHVGHPAVDLSVAHWFLPPKSHPRFCAAYGLIEETVWRLARFRALYHAAYVVVYSHEVGDTDLAREGLRALHYISEV